MATIEITNVGIKGPKGDKGGPGPIRTTYADIPGFVILGDSTAHQSNLVADISSLTSVGDRATIVGNLSNFMNVGQPCIVQGANEDEYNGVFTIDEVVDATTSKFTLASTPASATATGTIKATFRQRINDRNYAVISNAMSGHKGLYLGNFAMGGSPTGWLADQIALAFDPSNNPWGLVPKIAFISSGVNDARGVTSMSTIKTNLVNAIRSIQGYGATAIVLTNWPYDNTFVDWSVSNVARSRELNQWIRDTVPLLDGIVIDANQICMDLSHQYGNWKTNYATDGLHPSKVGGFQVAKNIKEIFWDTIESTDNRTVTSIATNADLSGTSGATSGTGASGSVADNHTMLAAGGGSQTVVGSKGLSLTGYGESQRLTITAAANDDSGAFRTGSFHAQVAAGNKIFCRVRVRTESDVSALRYINVTTNVVIGGVTTLKYANAIDSDSTTQRWGEKFDLTLETPPITVQDNTTIIYFEVKAVFGAAGSAVIDISDFDVFKIV